MALFGIILCGIGSAAIYFTYWFWFDLQLPEQFSVITALVALVAFFAGAAVIAIAIKMDTYGTLNRIETRMDFLENEQRTEKKI